MKRHLIRILAGAVACAALPRAQDDRPPRAVDDPRLQAAINDAIFRGCAHLRRTQRLDGSWSYDRPDDDGARRGRLDDATAGLTALTLYALAASGIPADDPAIGAGLAWVDDHGTLYGPDGRYGTYATSFLVLARSRIDARAQRRAIHLLAERLVDGQLPNGMWTYTLDDRRTASGPPATGRLVLRPERQGPGDNSNSQFAVLALWSAQELAGFRAPRRTWERIEGLYASSQHQDGGWSYRAPTTTAESDARAARSVEVRPSMTAAGLVSYVCATASLRGGAAGLAAARSTPVAVRGLAAFRRAPRDASAFRDFYFAYAVERVGTVLGLDDAEWYPGGARLLIAQQRDDGRFVPGWDRRRRDGGAVGHGDARQVYETALALLFLSRATVQPVTPSGTGR